MAVNSQTIDDIVSAIETTGSISKAAATIDSPNSSALAVFGAVNTLASQLSAPMSGLGNQGVRSNIPGKLRGQV